MKKLACCFCMIASACVAQAPTAPVKMGLWHGTAVSKMTGMQIPPEVVERMKQMGRSFPGMEPTTTETESCLTPEKWKEMFVKSQRDNCSVENLKQSASGMSADVVCTSARGGNSKGHFQMSFLNSEKAHGTMHLETSSPRQTQPIVMDVTYDSVYEGSDCKGISPDSPKILSK